MNAKGNHNPRDHWRQEKQAAWLYRIIAEREPNRRLRRMFRTLGQQAEAQALAWQAQMKADSPKLVFRPSLRAQLVAWLVRWAGPKPLRPVQTRNRAVAGLAGMKEPNRGWLGLG